MRLPRRLVTADTDIGPGVSQIVVPFTIPDTVSPTCALGRLTIKLWDIVTAATFTAYLSRDADGYFPLTIPSGKSLTHLDGMTDRGTVVYELGNLPYAPDIPNDEGFFLVLKIDAGTVTFKGILEILQA